jgi:S-adenosylmethionine hydrolase
LNQSPKASNLSLIANRRGLVGKRPIVVQLQFQTFIGPDNRVLTSALDPKSRTYELNNPKYFLKNISNTFHGRDLFAPLAAGIATTNISAELMSESFASSGTIEIKIRKNKIDGLVTGYFQVSPGQTGAILNSWDQVEIFCRDPSAEKKLKLKTGQTVTLKMK